jgi:hypothetical protein
MKYRKPIDKEVQDEPVPVHRIIILATKNTEGFESRSLIGFEKFNALKNNTYRFRFVEGLGMVKPHFGMISKLSGCLEVTQVKRPNGPLLLEELGDFVEEIF